MNVEKTVSMMLIASRCLKCSPTLLLVIHAYTFTNCLLGDNVFHFMYDMTNEILLTTKTACIFVVMNLPAANQIYTEMMAYLQAKNTLLYLMMYCNNIDNKITNCNLA